MAIKDKSTLLSEAQVIRDETTADANTATRVGQHLYDLIDSDFNLTDNDTDDITESTTKKFLNSAGTPQVIAGNKDFSGQVKGGDSSESFSATKTFDMNNGNMQKMTVTGNMTSLAISNESNGSSYLIILQIGGSGSYTIPQAGASIGTRTDNSVDDSVSSWYPTTVGSKIIYNINVEPDGDTHYSIETITV